MSQVLEVRNVSMSYGELEVLSDVSLSVAAGEVVVVMGSSGSGKSTLLRCINGLEKISRGSIVVAGKELSQDRRRLLDLRRSVGLIFQDFNLFPNMSAIDNVMLSPIKSLGIPKQEARALAEKLLERVKMSDRAEFFPSQLSGGQQQRVAIARALAMSPTLLLFDEPTSALDPENVRGVLSTMRDLAAEGRSMLVVTHETGFARTVADRVVYMEGGRVVEEGAPERFFDKPQDERTARFLGSVL